MNNDDEPIQLGLLPNFDVPLRLLQQLPKKTCPSVQKPDLSPKIQLPVQLDKVAGEITADKQSQLDATLAQPSSVWKRSQEFIVSVEGQDVRVNFKAFYFRHSQFSGGIHHFEFYGHISSTGYRSDFLQAKYAVNWANPTEYAKDKAQKLHAELLKEQRKQRRAIRRKVKNV